jgi:hypothetical protein
VMDFLLPRSMALVKISLHYYYYYYYCRP